MTTQLKAEQGSGSLHLELALKYAQSGLAVFPARISFNETDAKWDKIPCIKDWENKASTDPDQIRKWWQAFPQAAVGLVMGKNGLIAIDADRHGGPDGVEAFNRLANGSCPAHPIIDTAGNGEHHLFRQPKGLELGNGKKTLPAGIDVRGHGGWIVAPGVVRADGRCWEARKGTPGLVTSIKEESLPDLPEVFLDILRRSETASRVGSAPAPTNEKREGAYAEAALDGSIAELLATPEGERNTTLNAVVYRLARFVACGWLTEGQIAAAIEPAARTIGLGAEETAKTIASALKAGVTKPHPGLVDRQRPKSDPSGNGAAGGEPDNEPVALMLSDEALAIDYADRYSPMLRYTHALGKWMRYDGRRWQEDETLFVFDLARQLCRDAVAAVKGLPGVHPKLLSDTASAKKRAAVVSLAREDRRIAATVNQWDRGLYLLNTPNGVVDLETFEVRAHRSEHYLTQMTTVAPGAGCPRWLQFIDEITNGDKMLAAFLQRMAGYCLTGDTSEHALFFLYGTGSNGKSVFLSAMQGIFDGYHRAAPIETFTAARTDRHPTELAMLRGARLVTAVETEEGRRWAESRVKQLTGGDPIAARFMKQDFFAYVPQFKLVIAGNQVSRRHRVASALPLFDYAQQVTCEHN